MLKWSKTIFSPELICKEYDQLYDDVLLIEKPQPIVSAVKNEIKEAEKSPQQILELLHASPIKFWLVQNSCLEAVQSKKISSPTLQIGVATKDAKDAIEALYNKNNLEILISPNIQTKLISMYGKNYNVPSPVVSYLETRFGPKWRTLTT
jgi:hypothetical protein